MVVTVEVDDEEELIQQSNEGLEQGHTLVSVWHMINSKLSPSRGLQVLRRDRRNNVAFLCMTTTETTTGEITQAIKKLDVMETVFKVKRIKGAQQSNMPEDRSPRQNYPPPQRQGFSPPQTRSEARPIQQDQRRIVPFHQSQYTSRPPQQDRRQEPPRAPPPRTGQPTAPQQKQMGPPKARRNTYLSQEEYNKLDPAGRDALRAEREQANGGARS